jgi:hypothetical protein
MGRPPDVHGERCRRGYHRHGLLVIAALGLWVMPAVAGPPYVTDDPEPVEYRHWELYLASLVSRDAGVWSGTAPHVEVNYGAVPNLQLHIIAPMSFVRSTEGTTAYGYGDTELGAKYRFIQETSHCPQVGVFPLLEVPTGDRQRGLGSGHVQLFLPLWLQKAYGRWLTYGGGGYWINPGEGNHDWGFIGWQVQRQLFEDLSVGAEVFHTTTQEEGGEPETRFNVGAVLDLSDLQHVLVSAGRGLQGSNEFQGYVAFQLTFGPAQ